MSRAGAMGGGPPGMGGQKPSMRKALEVFENRHYRILWLSTLFAFTGMGMQQVARALLAWELTESYKAVGFIALSFGLPMLVLALVGGSLADRFEKRNLTLMTQGATALVMLTTALLITTGLITIELLFVVGLVQGTFFALGMPSRTPLMAEAVGPEKIMSAIAMSNAAMNFTRLFGPALVGALLTFTGIDTIYYAQAVLYVISFVVMFGVPTGLGEARRAAAAAEGGLAEGPAGAAMGTGRRPQGNMLQEIGLGLSYAWHHPRLRLLLGMMFVITMIGMPYVMLLPGFVQEDLGQSESAFGWLQSIGGVGALVASLGVATFTEYNRKPLLQWVAGLTGAAGLLLLGFGSTAFGFGGAIAAVIVLGLAFTGYQTLNNTMLMAEADPDYYGRVMSIMMMTFSGMSLMAAPLGLLADAIGPVATFALEGAVIAAAMLLVAVTNREYTFGREEAGTFAERQAAASATEQARRSTAAAGGGGGAAG